MKESDFLSFHIVVAVRDLSLPRRHDAAESASMKSVLLHLATYCSSLDGTHIFPKVDILVEKTGFSRRTIFYVLAALVEEGWLIPEPCQRGHTKGYQLSMDKLGLPPGGVPVKRKAPPPASAPTPPQEDYGDYNPPAHVPGGALASLRARREAKKLAKLVEEQ